MNDKLINPIKEEANIIDENYMFPLITSVPKCWEEVVSSASEYEGK